MNDVAQGALLRPIPFWYLRHGETDWNAQGLSQGNVDIPLNSTGIAQAQAAAQRLRNRGIASIVASPLSRAHDTARIVGEALDLPVRVDDGLREVRFGVQEGQPMSDWFSHWVDGRFTPDGAESFAALRQRGAAAINRSTALPPAVLVVAHGALFRALRTAMLIEPMVRTPNAVPIWCEPPATAGGAWQLRYDL